MKPNTALVQSLVNLAHRSVGIRAVLVQPPKRNATPGEETLVTTRVRSDCCASLFAGA